MSENQGEPTQFILNLKDKANLLVFYENQDYAKSLEMHFLRLGLASGQAVLYFSSQTIQDMENGLISAGIDIESFKERNLLRIFSTTTLESKQIRHIIEDFAKNSQKLDSFARIIIHRQNLSSKQYRNLELFEGFLDSLYQKHDVSILDSYDAEAVPDARFMQNIIRMHDHTIFAPSFGNGIVIKTK